MSRRRKQPTGWAVLGVTGEDGVFSPRSLAYNDRAYSWGFIAARVLGFRDLSYIPAAAMVEYSNAGTVSPPTIARADTIAYYATLAGSSSQDVLRVPLQVSPNLGVIPGYEAYFGPGQGNLLTYLIQTAGTVGLYGKPYGHASGSTVYGIGLVATPVPADRSQDILFSRLYYTTGAQVAQPPTGQVSAQYSVPFG